MSPASRVEQLGELIGRLLGLRVDEEDLVALLADRGGRDPDRYVARLAVGDTDELLAAARRLTVGESYFFRDPDKLEAFRSFLRRRLAANQRSIRVLSAGCAAGEEPYTLAMIGRDELGADATLQVTAVDINDQALARARAARYPAWSLRQTPPSLRARHFARVGRDYRVSAAVTEAVSFTRQNLTDSGAPVWRADRFDAVFCRNVTMYFTSEAARGVIERIAAVLKPDGLLLLGSAETLAHRHDRFEVIHDHQTFYYCRRSDETVAVSGPLTSPPPRRALAAPAATSPVAASVDAATPCPSDSVAAALELVAAERFAEALALLDGGDAASDRESLRVRAAIHANCGDIEAAEELCAELLRIDDLDAIAHYLLALCRDHAGDPDAAIEHDRTAAYLDPSFAMPHLHLGLLARRRADGRTARRELGLAKRLLESESPRRILLLGGGFDRERLIALCRAELSRGDDLV
jgi:chemotaxis protein methyltransferase CheR